ncbi:CcdB family protein [Hyphomonas sp.]|uniref:CcdB family protein n=1 Tax=Hyphomonas sp. TaxID=87 RepID=UPI00391A4416
MDYLAVFTLRKQPDRLVLILSHPLIAEASSVVAAPLLDTSRFAVAEGLNPVFDFGETRFALATEQMAAIPVKELGQQVTTLTAHEYPIANAINRLFFGI